MELFSYLLFPLLESAYIVFEDSPLLFFMAPLFRQGEGVKQGGDNLFFEREYGFQ